MSATLQVDHSDAIIEGSKYIVTGAENEKSSAELHENHPQEETVDKIKLDLETIQGDDALSEKAPRIPLSAMVMNGDNMKGGRDVSPKAAQSNEIEMEMDDDEIVDDDVCDDDDEEMEIDDTLVAMNAARDNAEQINQLDLDNIINQDTDHDDEGFTVHEHGDDDLEVECENCDRQRDMIERMQIELINSQEDTKVPCGVIKQ